MPAGLAETARSAPERILEAACDLIAAEGIDEVRIARVAQRAGASTALVHHYFSTREELLEQALLHSFELAGDERFAPGEDEGGTATAKLAAAIEECLPQEGRLERDWVLWVELWLRAARELAPWPTVAPSTTTTRPAPSSRAKTDAHPPTVPAPTTTTSALSLIGPPALARRPALP